MFKQRKAKYNPKDIIEIIWVDSHQQSGWLTADEIIGFINSKDTFAMHTVGYFIDENKEFVYVVQTYDSQGEVGYIAVIAIPKVSISRINLLSKAKPT